MCLFYLYLSSIHTTRYNYNHDKERDILKIQDKIITLDMEFSTAYQEVTHNENKKIFYETEAADERFKTHSFAQSLNKKKTKLAGMVRNDPRVTELENDIQNVMRELEESKRKRGLSVDRMQNAIVKILNANRILEKCKDEKKMLEQEIVKIQHA